MRRTIFCGLLLMAAGVSTWSATMVSAQVAGDAPRPQTGAGTQEVVEETVDPNGVPARRVPVTRDGRQEVVEQIVDSNGRIREERRFVAAPGQEPRAAFVAQGRSFVPVQIGLSEDDEELQKLRHQDAGLAHESAALLQKLGQVEGEAERAPLIEQLDEALGKQFDVQQQIREHEVARIEAKVKKLRETITKRAAARAAIIGNRREQLLRESEGLGWNSPDAEPPAALYRPVPVPNRPLPALGVTRPGAEPERKRAGR